MLKPAQKKSVNITINNIKKDNLPVSNLTLDVGTHDDINEFLENSASDIKNTNESGLPALAKHLTRYTPDHMKSNILSRFLLFASFVLVELFVLIGIIVETDSIGLKTVGTAFFISASIIYVIEIFFDLADETDNCISATDSFHQFYAFPVMKLLNMPNRNKDKAIIEDAQNFFSENDDETIVEDYLNGAENYDKRYVVINRNNSNRVYYFINIDNNFIHVTSVFLVNGLVCEYASRSRIINILDNSSGNSLMSITPERNESFGGFNPHNFCYSYSKRFKNLVRKDDKEVTTFHITNPVTRENGSRVDVEVKDNDGKIFGIDFQIKDGNVNFNFEEKSKNTYLFYKKNKDILRGKEGISTKIRSMGGRIFSGYAVGFLK